MKKIVSAALALVMCAGMSVTTFAESPIVSVGGNDSHAVKGTYKAGSSADKVYKVDISWGSMEFNYTDGNQGTWNPETHTYDGVTSGKWSCEKDANKITVVNHSNDSINSELAFKAAGNYSSIAGEFTDGKGSEITSLSLPTAEAYDAVNAGERAGSAFFDITEGQLTDTDSNVEIGTITVTVS